MAPEPGDDDRYALAERARHAVLEAGGMRVRMGADVEYDIHVPVERALPAVAQGVAREGWGAAFMTAHDRVTGVAKSLDRVVRSTVG
jgi:hypothetical protein